MEPAGGIIAFFGGAFDPVHFGHVKPALELCARTQIGQVRFVPGGEHPYAKNTESCEHRLRMLELVHKPPRLVVDGCACERTDLIYTVDLLEYARTRYGEDRSLALTVGTDGYHDMRNWKDAERIKDLAHIIVLTREACRGTAGKASSLDALALSSRGLTHYFDNTVVDASSTRIRALLNSGEQPAGLTPGAVWNYIRRHELYKA